MLITVTLPVSTSSVVTQTSTSELIRWLPSSNADFIWICLYLTPCSFSVAGLPPRSRDCSGKVMVFFSFTSAWNLVISHGHVLPTISGLYLRSSSNGWCRDLPLILSSTISHLTILLDSDIFVQNRELYFLFSPARSFRILHIKTDRSYTKNEKYLFYHKKIDDVTCNCKNHKSLASL